MFSASCRRLLHRNGIFYSRHQLQRTSTVAKLLRVLSGWPTKRSFCASVSLNKLNQPKLKEEIELSSDLTHPQPRPPGVLPPDHTHAKEEDSKLRSPDHAAAAASTSAVDGVLHERHQYYEEGQGAWIEGGPKEVVEGRREEQRQEGEEGWAHSEITWRRLPSIYFKLSKSRLTGMSRC